MNNVFYPTVKNTTVDLRYVLCLNTETHWSVMPL